MLRSARSEKALLSTRLLRACCSILVVFQVLNILLSCGHVRKYDSVLTTLPLGPKIVLNAVGVFMTTASGRYRKTGPGDNQHRSRPVAKTGLGTHHTAAVVSTARYVCLASAYNSTTGDPRFLPRKVQGIWPEDASIICKI
jgi:hypothetical protein